MSTEKQFCSFVVQEFLFGVAIEEVQELIRHQAMTIIPLSSDKIGGLINLRGQIVVAIDLRQCLGLPPRSPEESPMNVILRTSDGLVSLLVDEIGDVVEVPDGACDPPPQTLCGIGRELIKSVVMLKDNLLLILDIHRVLSMDSAPTLTASGD